MSTEKAGLHYGRFFSQTHLVTLKERAVDILKKRRKGILHSKKQIRLYGSAGQRMATGRKCCQMQSKFGSSLCVPNVETAKGQKII
jgi:hypothetical protein